MRRNGYITPDEFDALYMILEDKRIQYDAALTEFMVAMKREKGKYKDNQIKYWQNCIAACKDILSYARHMIRNNPNAAIPRSEPIGNSAIGRVDTARNQHQWWNDNG